MTDSNSDIPFQLAEKHGITIISMPYIVDGKEYYDDSGRSGGAERFYKAMREGAVPTTSLLTAESYAELFRPIMDRGQDVLFIAFASALSATQKYAVEARDQIAPEYPKQRLEIVDSLSISLGMVPLLMEAVKMRDAGFSLEEVRDWLTANRQNVQEWFVVDDLKYLRRGGRISATSAVFGTVLDIKPILWINADGLVVAQEKAKGRKKAMRTIVERLGQYIGDPAGKLVCIPNADCPADAERLAEMVRSAYPAIGDVLIGPVGPTVGSHAGPDTLALCFLGAPRSEVKS